MFPFPPYRSPDFTAQPLADAPAVSLCPAPADGVLPEGFHVTSNLPEYLHLGGGRWILARESRMDGVFVLRGEELQVIEPRHVRRGDPVVIGRGERGEQGILVHDTPFAVREGGNDRFGFRARLSRETPFSHFYDELYALLRHEREHGMILWVLGPAVVFDHDSRTAMAGLIEAGYCHALLAGNALAVHDLEAARFRTGLGQDIYTRDLVSGGHYHHLDIINEVRRHGSLAATVSSLGIREGVIPACLHQGIPLVLCGSIRDDGPLPEVITDTSRAQDAMRFHARRATTVIAVATQLHAIATGNMIPGYRQLADGTIRPVYFYLVDMSEFVADKLANRGSYQSRTLLTNAQDFVVNVCHNLCGDGREGEP